MKRAIQKFIEDPLAEEIIKSTLQEGDTIRMDVNEEKTELNTVISDAVRHYIRDVKAKDFPTIQESY